MTTSQPASTTRRVFDEAARVIPGGTSRVHYYYHPHPIYARSARGCRLTDVDGVDRLDFLNNMTALIHGHTDPAITAAISEQLARGTAWSEPGESEVELAARLVDRVTSLERVRFSNSGTESVMLAIKLARAFTGRSRIAKFEGFYHGYYDYVQVSFAGTPANWGPADSPASTASSGGLARDVLNEVLVVPFNDPAALERLLERHGRELAAFIVDPLSARAGLPLPEPGFLEHLTDITGRYGIVLIYDEVVSFRLAWGGAQARYGGRPDLTTFGKIIGGGLPVGAVGGRADIMGLLDPSAGPPRVLSGGTFSANPLTMVAGIAALERLTPDAIERLNDLGDRLRREANEVLRRAGLAAQLTGDGSLFRFVLTRDRVVDYRSSVVNAAPPSRMARLHELLMEEGIIISVMGLGCLSTPMGDREVDDFVAALERALARW